MNNFLLDVSNHALKDTHILNYGPINNTNSLYYSSVEVLADYINAVIAIHVSFYKQLYFVHQLRVTYGRMNFQSESWLAVDYSIYFYPQVA